MLVALVSLDVYWKHSSLRRTQYEILKGSSVRDRILGDKALITRNCWVWLERRQGCPKLYRS